MPLLRERSDVLTDNFRGRVVGALSETSSREHSMPTQLVSDALCALALQGGRDGFALDQLFVHVPCIDGDAAAQAFLWQHLCAHSEVSVKARGHTHVQLAQLTVEDAGSVHLTASAVLRHWLLGIRDGMDDGSNPAKLQPEQSKVMEEVGCWGRDVGGVLQSELTKSLGGCPSRWSRRHYTCRQTPTGNLCLQCACLCVAAGIPANKLAYSLESVERARWIHRQSVRVIMSGSREAKTTHTNLLSLNAQRLLPTVAGWLHEFTGIDGRQAGLLVRMIKLLARASCRLLPLFRLRLALGLAGKPHHNVWERLKKAALRANLIEEVLYNVAEHAAVHAAANADTSPDADNIPYAADTDVEVIVSANQSRSSASVRVRRGIRLPCAQSGASAAMPSRLTGFIDQSPLSQASMMLQQSGSAGLLAPQASEVLALHHKLVNRRLHALVSVHGASSRPEQHGRVRAYRYFGVEMARGKDTTPQGNSASHGGASVTSGGSGTRTGAESDGMLLGKRDRGTLQAIQRRRWLLQHLQSVHVVPVDVLRRFLHTKHRVHSDHLVRTAAAPGLASKHDTRPQDIAPIDRATVMRLIESLVASGDACQLRVPHPLTRRLPAGTAAQPATCSSALELELLVTPGIDAGSEAVRVVLEEIRQARTFPGHVHQYALQHVSGARDLKASTAKVQVTPLLLPGRATVRKEGCRRIRNDGSGRAARTQHAAHQVKATEDEVHAFDFPEDGCDMDGIGSLATRLGFMPGRALRAQRLHALLVERAMRQGSFMGCALAKGSVLSKNGAAAKGSTVAGGGTMATSDIVASSSALMTHGGTHGEVPDAVIGPIIERCALDKWLLVPDYFLICGLGAMPPEPDTLISESRKDTNGEAMEMRALPERLRSFFLSAGAQQAKATERLRGLLLLLQQLQLIIPEDKSTPSRDCAPLRFRVARFVCHRDWRTTVQEGRALEMIECTQRFIMTSDEDRAEYWEALKAICIMEQPKRNCRHPKGTDATHVMHLGPRPTIVTTPQGAGMATGPPTDLSMAAANVLMTLRETQWSTVRPLTSRQKMRLMQDAPSASPETQLELMGWADRLEVHPLQLLNFIRNSSGGKVKLSRKRKRKFAPPVAFETPQLSEHDFREEDISRVPPANPRTVTGSTVRVPRAAGLVAATRVHKVARSVAKARGSCGDTDGIVAAVCTASVDQEGASQACVPEAKRSWTAGESAEAPARVVHCASDCHAPSAARAEAGGGKIVWQPHERESLLVAWSSELVELCKAARHQLHKPISGIVRPDALTDEKGLVADVFLRLDKQLHRTNAALANHRLASALTSLNARLNWLRLERAVGRPAKNCQKIISRTVLARNTSHKNLHVWRRKLAFKIGDGLRVAGLQITSPCRRGTLADCFATVATGLGVDLASGAVDFSNYTAQGIDQRPESARQAALIQRLLAMMAVPDADYCPRLSAESLNSFSIEETQDALRMLVKWGWAVKNKVTGPSLRRFTLSHRYLQQQQMQCTSAILADAAQIKTTIAAMPRPTMDFDAVINKKCATRDVPQQDKCCRTSTRVTELMLRVDAADACLAPGDAADENDSVRQMMHAVEEPLACMVTSAPETMLSGLRADRALPDPISKPDCGARLPATMGTGGVVQMLEMALQREVKMRVQTGSALSGAARPEMQDVDFGRTEMGALADGRQNRGSHVSTKGCGARGHLPGFMVQAEDHPTGAMTANRLRELATKAQTKGKHRLPAIYLVCERSCTGPGSQGMNPGAAVQPTLDMLAGALTRTPPSATVAMATMVTRVPKYHNLDRRFQAACPIAHISVRDESSEAQGEDMVEINQQSVYIQLCDAAATRELRMCVEEAGEVAATMYACISVAGNRGTTFRQLLHGFGCPDDSSTRKRGCDTDEDGHGMGVDDGPSGSTQASVRPVPKPAALCALRALWRRSLVVRVCMGDERRYVTHSFVSFWAARPYTLETRQQGNVSDSEPPSDAGETIIETADKASLTKGRIRAVKRAWVATNVTQQNKRPRYHSEVYFVPEDGRTLAGSRDEAHFLHLRAAIMACIAANPGVSESQLFERFWAQSKCHVRDVMDAMNGASFPRATLCVAPGTAGVFISARTTSVSYFCLAPTVHSLTDA